MVLLRDYKSSDGPSFEALVATGALHSSLPPRNYPYQSTWSVSAVLRDTSPWVLINFGASVNNRWNEARYLDVDIPDIYYQKQSQTLCIKKNIQ